MISILTKDDSHERLLNSFIQRRIIEVLAAVCEDDLEELIQHEQFKELNKNPRFGLLVKVNDLKDSENINECNISNSILDISDIIIILTNNETKLFNKNKEKEFSLIDIDSFSKKYDHLKSVTKEERELLNRVLNDIYNSIKHVVRISEISKYTLDRESLDISMTSDESIIISLHNTRDSIHICTYKHNDTYNIDIAIFRFQQHTSEPNINRVFFEIKETIEENKLLVISTIKDLLFNTTI